MKPFATYQHVKGEPMTPRDKKEVGSKFWNEGKWDNFVLPLLPENCQGLTLIDMGCNAGLFLKLAEEYGFKTVIGVDSDKDAVDRAYAYRSRVGGNYVIRKQRMEDCIDSLPMSDVTVLANAHYYFMIGDWVDYLDKLRTKTRYCIVVTDQDRKPVNGRPRTDAESVTSYFKGWAYKGCSEADKEGDPHPRELLGLSYENSLIERVLLKGLDNGNHVQDHFYKELDEGKHYNETKYYRIIRKYRLEDKKDWSEARLEEFFKARVVLYNDVKRRGQLTPILVNSKGRVVDGNHRYQIMKHLGYDSLFVRRVI